MSTMIPKEKLCEMYTKMLQIRKFDEKIAYLSLNEYIRLSSACIFLSLVLKINKFQKLCLVTTIFQQIGTNSIGCKCTETLLYNSIAR